MKELIANVGSGAGAAPAAGAGPAAGGAAPAGMYLFYMELKRSS